MAATLPAPGILVWQLLSVSGDAVLAQEFAHVRERHRWILHGNKILAAAFPYLPLFRTARRELSDLVELRADDCAARRHGRKALLRAILTVADGRAPQAALGAGGAQAVLRVGRLLNPAQPIGRLAASLGLAMACALPLLPVVLLVAPGMLASLTADFAHLCPLSWA